MGWPANLKTVVTEFGNQTSTLCQAGDEAGTYHARALIWSWQTPGAWKNRNLFKKLPQKAFTMWQGYSPTPRSPVTETPYPERGAEAIEKDVAETVEEHHSPKMSPESYARYWAKTQEELLALKAFCDAKGVRLILFSAPISSFYRERIPALWNQRFADQQAWLREQGFEYYDYRALMEDFWMYDAHHLRPAGAKHFTDFFLKEHGLE